MFAAYGLPPQLMSENSPQFTVNSLQTSCKSKECKTLSVHHSTPLQNGAAERLIQTFKKAMRSSKETYKI